MNGPSNRKNTQPPAVDTRLVQFRLSTLLVLIALCSAVFATMMAFGALWSLLLLFAAILISAHMLGNVVGTRLRDNGSLLRTATRPRPERVALPQLTDDPPRLRSRSSLGRLVVVITAAGAMVGVLVGRYLFTMLDHGQLGSNDWSVAIVSFAVLGGLFGFLATSFFKVGCWPAVIGICSWLFGHERR